MKYLIIALFFIIVISFLDGCHHDADLTIEPPRPPRDTTLLCSADTVYFQNTVFPVINSGCAKSKCHDAATHQSGVTLDNYADIMKLVHPYNAASSKLYKMLFSNEDGRMPPDEPFTTEQKSIIFWWISQGGLNNGCSNILCDSSVVTYTTKIQPILNNWCVGCHNANNPSGGYMLDSYDEAVATAGSGRLMGALRHESGFQPMPKNATLPQCAINLFQIWINTGTPQ